MHPKSAYCLRLQLRFNQFWVQLFSLWIRSYLDNVSEEQRCIATDELTDKFKDIY